MTSLGGIPLDVAGWDLDACYSCTQKCLGAPCGLAPIVFAPRALERRVACRSFYLDLVAARGLLGTAASTTTRFPRRSSTRSHEALAESRRKGSRRAGRGTRGTTRALTAGLDAMGLPLAAARRRAVVDAPHAARPGRRRRGGRAHGTPRAAFNIEIGAGLGPLAGRIWRVGLMGASSTAGAVVLLLGALEERAAARGARGRERGGHGAALDALGS